jgi:hypothetical protein
MPRAKAATYYVIPRATLDDLGVHSTLDMLRYDGATVECNPPDGYYLLRCEGRGPCVERWSSFGVSIAPWQVDRTATGPWRVNDQVRAHEHEVARAREAAEATLRG